MGEKFEDFLKKSIFRPIHHPSLGISHYVRGRYWGKKIFLWENKIFVWGTRFLFGKNNEGGYSINRL
eukprot:UN07294